MKNITFFATQACNNSCRHCFYQSELNQPRSRMSIAEIGTFAASLRRPVRFCVTGGEPFLRPDLAEVCEALIENNGCRALQLTTNGSFPERVEALCRRLLSRRHLRDLSVQVSLDGLASTHDRLRGLPGSFSLATDTIERAARLRRRHPALSVEIATTLLASNQSEIEGLIRYTQRFAAPHKFMVLRGAYATFGVPPELSSALEPVRTEELRLSSNELAALVARIEELNDGLPHRFHSELQRKKLRLMLDTLRSAARMLPCPAGTSEAVVYSDGDVAVCEQSRPIGNLKDASFDFYRIWNGLAARSTRSALTKCACVAGGGMVDELSNGLGACVAGIGKRLRRAIGR